MIASNRCGAHQRRCAWKPTRRWAAAFLVAVVGVFTGGCGQDSGKIPAGVDAAIISFTTVYTRSANDAVSYGPVTVDDEEKVARIASIINAARPPRPGNYNCPADRGGALAVDFRSSASGRSEAVATIHLSGCGGVTVQRRHRRPVFLEIAGDAAGRIIDILGVNWPWPPS